MVFFLILVGLLFSNELLKHQISNKYLQFGAYFFVSFTFFTFVLPVFLGRMDSLLFFISGVISLVTTSLLIAYLYLVSPSTRQEVTAWKISLLIMAIYITINACYYFNLIPPVPLSLQSGMVAYNVVKQQDEFRVSYEQTAYYDFWETYDKSFHYTKGDTVFVFTSIFAPTDLRKSVQHEWKWYDPDSSRWNTTDTIAYEVIGGREGGFRGYTLKENIWPGRWQVDVTTDEGLVLGKITFTIINDSTFRKSRLTKRRFN